MLYNGALDLSCNHVGTTHSLEMTDWNGLYWTDAERSLMVHGDDVFGQHYQLQNLSFLVIQAAGHFVPTDQPSGALDMIDRFLNEKSFSDISLPKDRAYVDMPTEQITSGAGYESRDILIAATGGKTTILQSAGSGLRYGGGAKRSWSVLALSILFLGLMFVYLHRGQWEKYYRYMCQYCAFYMFIPLTFFFSPFT